MYFEARAGAGAWSFESRFEVPAKLLPVFLSDQDDVEQPVFRVGGRRERHAGAGPPDDHRLDREVLAAVVGPVEFQLPGLRWQLVDQRVGAAAGRARPCRVVRARSSPRAGSSRRTTRRRPFRRRSVSPLGAATSPSLNRRRLARSPASDELPQRPVGDAERSAMLFAEPSGSTVTSRGRVPPSAAVPCRPCRLRPRSRRGLPRRSSACSQPGSVRRSVVDSWPGARDQRGDRLRRVILVAGARVVQEHYVQGSPP